MKIQMGNKNQKDPKNKIIFGVVGVVVLVAVIAVGGMFIGKNKSTDDKSTDDKSKEVIAEESENEELVADEEAVTDEEAAKKNTDGKEDVDETSNNEDVLEGDDDVLSKDDDKYKDTAGGVTEERSGKEPKTEKVKEYALGDTVKLDKFEVTVNSAKKVKDDKGNDAMVIDYNIKNNHSNPANWSTAILTHTSQNDKELKLAKIKGSNDKDIDDVKSGKTMKGIKESFIIGDKGKIHLEITELISGKQNRALFVFDKP